MTTPVVNGGFGDAGLGDLGLGGSQPAQNFALATMAKLQSPYIAHLYDHNLVFKRTLGGATPTQPGLLNKPGLKMTQNGGFQTLSLEISAPIAGIALGDVVRLTEQGDSTGQILFSGNVETVPEDQSPAGTHHQVVVVPWMTELGDGYFNKTYAVPTDVAQFVRDAVATTAHCSVNRLSCPDTGITAVYDFQNTNPLDAIHVAKQIAGSNYWYHCDAEGIVWFQPVSIDASHPAMLTLRKGAEVASRKPLATNKGMKNKIPVIGGANPGDPGRIHSLYDNPTSQAANGLRAFNPTLSYPNVTDQPTLDAIAASLGAQYDRVVHTDEVFCPALGKRLAIGRRGGLTVRVWESAVEALQESGEPGAGTYGPTLILQDVEVDGPSQRLFLGDIPYADIDPAYEAARVAQRTSVIMATAVPTPAVAPQPLPPPPPVTTIIAYGLCFSVLGLQPMGGGIVTVASSTFVLPAPPTSMTCQVVGSIDARMDAWDNSVGTPRRAVRATLSGGIYTGAWQELPFGLTRATYDLSSASGIAITAGTYTVSLQIDTVEFNQIRIYSGFVQVVVTAS